MHAFRVPSLPRAAAGPAVVGLAAAVVAFVAGAAVVRAAPPTVTESGPQLRIEGAAYRVAFTREVADLVLELRTGEDAWRPVTKIAGGVGFGVLPGGGAVPQLAVGQRCGWSLARDAESATVAWHVPLDPLGGLAMSVVLVCTAEGVLVGSRIEAGGAEPAAGVLWSPPRVWLTPADWESYAFRGADGRRHAGRIADLQPLPAYAGVSPWGPTGDTVTALDPARPVLTVYRAGGATGLGVVYVDYGGAWRGSSGFVQVHTASALFLYAGYTPTPGSVRRWAWLAPFGAADPESEARQTDALLALAGRLLPTVGADLPPLPPAAQPVPDFPADLRRPQPVADIRDAVVYTINEDINTDYGLALARKCGSDVLVRAWFKWGQRPTVESWRHYPEGAHRLGALFGGGITCSALYDSENGLAREQVLDMATRGADGQLVDAWDTPGVRHGSLSSPAYLDYLFRWCREQIDAGVDYLFMDEHQAALSEREGYDDHSLRDFRAYLLGEWPQARGWTPVDPRWQTEFGVPLADRTMCASGQMDSFDYRAYLRACGTLDTPLAPANKLAGAWLDFRRWRDDRAWKALTDRIRAYAKEHGRRVLISANGLARYVDLQVLGVWGKWNTSDHHIDLRENQVGYWRSLVVRGHDLAGGPVPVVLFHDWGFGEPPFPWLAVAPSEREVWMRTRGAEIYAAGAFFAFPVLGPFNCDAGRDGSLGVIARQTAFYQSHRELYLHSRWLGAESLTADRQPLSLAAWWHAGTKTLLLHVVNRDVQAGELRAVRTPLTLRLPVGAQPQGAAVISPDATGEGPATARPTGDGLEVVLPGLEAYSVVLLRYEREPDLGRLADPVRVHPEGGWSRPLRNDFAVHADGSVGDAGDLNAYLQGMLHTHLRNPPVFRVNATGACELRIRVRAVASAGATLSVRVDDAAPTVVELPDLDGRNDGTAPEYDRTVTFTLPAGQHRVAVDNPGKDWLVWDWLEFAGPLAEAAK